MKEETELKDRLTELKARLIGAMKEETELKDRLIGAQTRLEMSERLAKVIKPTSHEKQEELTFKCFIACVATGTQWEL